MAFLIKICLSLAVFLAPLLFGPWSFGKGSWLEGTFWRYALFFLLVSMGLLLMLAKMILGDREVRLPKTPFTLPLAFLVLIGGVSFFFSEDRWASLMGWNGALFQGFFWIAGMMGLYILLLHERTFLLNLFLVSVAAGTALAYFVGGMHGAEEFAVFLAVVAVVLMGQASQNKVVRVIGLIGLMGLIGLIGFMGYKPALGVLVAGSIVLLGGALMQRVRGGEGFSLRKIALPLVVGIGAVALLGVLQEPAPDLDSETSWQIAFSTATNTVKHALIGSGPGTFDIDFLRFRPNEQFEQGGNVFSEALATQGFLGLGIRLFVFVTMLLALCIVVAFTRSSPRALSLLGGVGALFAAQFLSSPSALLEFCLWFFAGLSVLLMQHTQETVISFKKHVEIALLGRVLFGVVVVGLGITWWQGARIVLAETAYQNNRLEEAVQLNPWETHYKIALSQSYLRRAMQELAQPESAHSQSLIALYAQQAIFFANAATASAPHRVEAWEQNGRVYRELRSAPGAAKWAENSFAKALDLDPANPFFYTELGTLAFAQQDFGQAKAYFTTALSLKKHFSPARFHLALIKEAGGSGDQAILDLQELIGENPQEPEYLFQLGRIYYNRNELEKAVAQFQKVLEVAPNHSNAHYSLGIAYEKEGKISEALKEFERVLGLNPNNQEVQKKLELLRKKP